LTFCLSQPSPAAAVPQVGAGEEKEDAKEGKEPAAAPAAARGTRGTKKVINGRAVGIVEKSLLFLAAATGRGGGGGGGER